MQGTRAGSREALLAPGLAALTLGWNLYGFAGNFFAHYWPAWVTPVAYLVNLVLLAGLLGAGIGDRRGSTFLLFAGALMALWSLVGTVFEVAALMGRANRPLVAPPLNLPQPPPLLGPLVPTVTGLLAAIFALRWRTSSY